jgi:ribonuclease HI
LDCHQCLRKLAEHERVQLIWVPSHRGTEDNETAYHLARLEFECPFIGPEPALGILTGIAKKAARDRTEATKNTGNP